MKLKLSKHEVGLQGRYRQRHMNLPTYSNLFRGGSFTSVTHCHAFEWVVYWEASLFMEWQHVEFLTTLANHLSVHLIFT